MAFKKDFKVAEGPIMQKMVNSYIYTIKSLAYAVSFVFLFPKGRNYTLCVQRVFWACLLTLIAFPSKTLPKRRLKYPYKE